MDISSPSPKRALQKLTVSAGFLQKIKKLAPEFFGNHLNWNKELFAGADKTKTIATKPTPGNDNVNMGMKR